MLLRNSISKAKKLLNNTIQSFKTLLSGGYQRLPKTPPFNPFSCGGDSNMHHSFRELDTFYEEFTGRWAVDQEKSMKRKTKNKPKEPTKEEADPSNGSFMKFANMNSRQQRDDCSREKEKRKRRVEEEKEAETFSHNLRVEACNMVAERLKELELMDISNVDYVLDIEEVLHYYSRITCPFYVDIVNRFFMEMYAEFLVPQTSSSSSHNISGHISSR
ncbi:uncharacterized protein LOC131256671 [Magnolia sinica]|uniref:uncharacterized protein LOC131256671 n=1 Tax=Magnolia sinica TaxID=86752 RepID=UPI00265A0E12|nr:uncharacterized protein LOC131256671 [Magnolia sinica]